MYFFLIAFRSFLNLLDRQFLASHSRPTGWTHVVLNYIGPHVGEGIRNYYNGQEVASDTDKERVDRSTGDGRIVVGREYTDGDRDYASVQVDELIYFNAVLTHAEVQSIYNSA